MFPLKQVRPQFADTHPALSRLLYRVTILSRHPPNAVQPAGYGLLCHAYLGGKLRLAANNFYRPFKGLHVVFESCFVHDRGLYYNLSCLARS